MKIGARIKNYISKELFALEAASVLLSAVLLATAYSLFETPVWLVILFGLLEVMLCVPFAMLCHFTNKHRKLGTVLCIAIYGVLLFGLAGLNYPGYSETGESFVQWMVQDIEGIGWSMSYGAILCVGGALFFGTCNYYFSVVQYRLGMLVVVSIIPCVLYAKAIADVNNWYLVFIAGMNVIIAILRRKYDRAEETKAAEVSISDKITKKEDTVTDRLNKVVSIGVIIAVAFTAIVLLICAAIPKKADAIYYDKFEDTFLGGDTNSALNDVSGELSALSGNADGYRSVSNRRIYRINGVVTYLKRQSFDVYDFDNDRWYALDDYSQPVYEGAEWFKNTENLSISELHEAIKLADEISPGFAEKYGLEEVVNTQERFTPEVSIQIHSLNFAASYYVVPSGARAVYPDDGDGVLVSRSGTFTRSGGMHDENFGYRVLYRGDRKTNLSWCGIGGSSKTSDEAFQMLSELLSILMDAQNSKKYGSRATQGIYTTLAFLEENTEAIEYMWATARNSEMISEEVRALAEEITADCEYDWEKAQALQEYFHTGEYIYDINYYAPDNSVEYFLFESKRGTCSDYATAYVLLARSVGLTVRYTEGYMAKSSGTDGYTYYIKESNGHAFPEVYLPATGWTIFEPTSGVLADEEEKGFWDYLSINIQMDYELIMTIGIIVASIALLIMIVRLFIPFIIEQIFIGMLRSGKKTAADAYLKILKRAKRGRLKKKYRKLVNRDNLVSGKDPFAMAPVEVVGMFDEIKVDIRVICDAVEASAYRNPESTLQANKNERIEICKNYKKIMSIFK